MPLIIILTSLTCFGFLLTFSPTVKAQACTVTHSPTIADFGSITSFAIENTTQQIKAEPGAGLNCRGSLLGLIYSGDYLNATITSVNNSQLKNETNDYIGYQIFADPTHNEQLQLNTPYNYYNSYILGLLGILGGSAADIPMYFKIPSTSTNNLAVGHYSDTLSIDWKWNICTGIGLLGICIGSDQGVATSAIDIKLEILPDCVISAPDIHFGTAPLVLAFSPVTQTISIRCSKGQSYSVGLSDGLHAQGSQRRLHYEGNYLAYEIFKGLNNTQRWGRLGSERRLASEADINPNLLDGISVQGFHYQAIINPNQSTPPPGQYHDSITIDVEF